MTEVKIQLVKKFKYIGLKLSKIQKPKLWVKSNFRCIAISLKFFDDFKLFTFFSIKFQFCNVSTSNRGVNIPLLLKSFFFKFYKSLLFHYLSQLVITPIQTSTESSFTYLTFATENIYGAKKSVLLSYLLLITLCVCNTFSMYFPPPNFLTHEVLQCAKNIFNQIIYLLKNEIAEDIFIRQ